MDTVNKIPVTGTYIRAERVTMSYCTSDWLWWYRVMFVPYLTRIVLLSMAKSIGISHPLVLAPLTLKLQYGTAYGVRTYLGSVTGCYLFLASHT
jgi:hypothetical protein